jgi:hypothetical protein
MYKYGTLTSGKTQFVAQLIVKKSTHDIENPHEQKPKQKEKPFHSTILSNNNNNKLRSLLLIRKKGSRF